MIYKTTSFMTITSAQLSYLQVFCAQQTSRKKKFFNRVSIDRETWNTLDSQDKAAWDTTVSPAAKAKILNGTLKRGKEPVLTHKPVSSTYSKPITKTPILNTHQANIKNMHNDQEGEPERTEEPPEEPPAHLGSFSHDILDSKLLVNFAKSKLPPSDICAILSQPTTKDKAKQASRLPSQYDVGFHQISDTEHITQNNVSVLLQIFLGCLWFLSTLWSPKNGSPSPILHASPFVNLTAYRISVSVHKSSHSGCALIDRGANGGIAGNDVQIISTTGCTIDVMGIDNHQLCSIKIGTVCPIMQL
jgi:hypothetical protein